MKSIAIYVEGGGDGSGSHHAKRELRQGFDVLFQRQKTAAQAKKLGWQLIPCGSRNQTFQAFRRDLLRGDAETLFVLLVDSEDPLAREIKGAEVANAKVRVEHLTQRDGWDLSDADPQQVHLMVQCMETWIVSDPDAVTDYYRTGFRRTALPLRNNLEEEAKRDVFSKLKVATARTQKGEYAKIKHASKLLALIAPLNVAQRCPRFKTFTDWLDTTITS